MNVIDQNTAFFSLERNLVPGRSLIDDRSERERLAFLAKFAELINFYDENNNISGNWAPFLLKDPVFLLASVSQTGFTKWNSLYVSACLKIENGSPLTMDSTDLGPSFNQLFDQFMDVFMRIERWTFYMQKMEDQYDLKSYVLDKVENVFSAYFWALRAFKEALFMSGLIRNISPVQQFYFSEAFTDTLWTQARDKIPYWDVLGIQQDLDANTAGDFFSALKSAGDQLFVFFHTIIQHAAPEYEKLESAQGRYADTTLLRAFVSLLKVQQDQLNGISAKYLGFYYRDILKQAKLFAVPDEVILCAETAKKDAAFHLPAGTQFDAGMDADKNPVTYANTEEVTLNPAAITSAYTLSCLPSAGASSGLSSLYFQAIPDPGVIQRGENGAIQQWETFGGDAPPADKLIQLAFAFASPMLLLREGVRTITLDLTFGNQVELALLRNAVYYVSTLTAWHIVQRLPDTSKDAVADSTTIMFVLDASEPPVEKFATDPDGVNSLWPMMKIAFSSFSDMANPPVVTGLKIGVSVAGIRNLQLYNDNGLLTTKTPFQPFGPIPLKSSSFIIGSNEIFSKPFNELITELTWDALPASFDFELYYRQYNAYLLESGIAIIVTPEEIKKNPQPAKDPLKVKKPSGIRRLFTWAGGLLKRKQAVASTDENESGEIPVPVPLVPSYFNNFCFTVDFRLLSAQSWENFSMQKVQAGENDFVPYITNAACMSSAVVVTGLTPPPFCEGTLLFSTEDCLLTNKSYFRHTGQEAADPFIQNSPLLFTDTSTSGFIRMELCGPAYGFGAELYANLVSDIALRNARRLIELDREKRLEEEEAKDPTEKNKAGDKKTGEEKKQKDKKADKPVFIAPAVLPFVPKLAGFTAHYSAEQFYNLTAEIKTGDYPLQCFFYSPFENYSVYDNSPAAAELISSAGLTITGIVWETSGLPLFPRLDYKGVLFLEIENLVPADALSIYFKLSRKYAGTDTKKLEIGYHYLAVTGWKELKVLADSTNKFTCSGVIKVNVPLDMATDTLVFPDKKYWISIGVKDDPGSFAETVFLKTNGFYVQRSGLSFLAVTEKPRIPAGTIVQTKMPVPQISAIVQPFPSQGGRAAETETTMNRRVSNRMKTKDRAVTAGDYFRLIRQEFDDIYYSKVVYDPAGKSTEIYVVKAYDRATDPNAFLPLVSECGEQKIEDFLKARASAFARISVSNFKIEYVKVKAVVVIKDGYEKDGVRKNIIEAINIFLSPWIASSQQQLKIDQGLSDGELAAFIKNMDGVFSVESVSFQTCPSYVPGDITPLVPVDQQGGVVMPLSASALFVPNPTHDIKFS
jgi:hypothetical protein